MALHELNSIPADQMAKLTNKRVVVSKDTPPLWLRVTWFVRWITGRR